MPKKKDFEKADSTPMKETEISEDKLNELKAEAAAIIKEVEAPEPAIEVGENVMAKKIRSLPHMSVEDRSKTMAEIRENTTNPKVAELLATKGIRAVPEILELLG